ncbi:MAG: glycosyltransferase family 2 protein [bacterium]
MASIQNIVFYILTFLSVYVQVFFLVTFFENRKKIFKVKYSNFGLASYPSVSVIVPCFNEEKSVAKTINSLLNLDYPKDKLKIIVVDDGSQDKTWEVIQQFNKISNIKLIKKVNGGKFTALNLGLEYVDTEFFSCLDADSIVKSCAMKKIMKYFVETDTMAVIPSALVTTPTNFIQKAQEAEYDMAVFFKKIFSLIGGLNVTPGTLPVYRKKVIEMIGKFKHGHNGEDMEMAFRMQKNNLKIVQCHEAVVYTIPPNSIRVLYSQRVRWLSAFLQNIFDYKNMLFKNKYGNFGWFTLPAGIISTITVIFIFLFSLYNIFNFLINNIIEISMVGFKAYFHHSYFKFDWFFVNINVTIFIVILSYSLLISSLLIGSRLARGKARFSVNLLYFVGIYSFIAPFWMMKSVYNTVLSKKTIWK